MPNSQWLSAVYISKVQRYICLQQTIQHNKRKKDSQIGQAKLSKTPQQLQGRNYTDVIWSNTVLIQWQITAGRDFFNCSFGGRVRARSSATDISTGIHPHKCQLRLLPSFHICLDHILPCFTNVQFLNILSCVCTTAYVFAILLIIGLLTLTPYAQFCQQMCHSDKQVTCVKNIVFLATI